MMMMMIDERGKNITAINEIYNFLKQKRLSRALVFLLSSKKKKATYIKNQTIRIRKQY